MLRVVITIAGTVHPPIDVATPTAARATIGEAVESHAAGLAEDARAELYTTTVAGLNGALSGIAEALRMDRRWNWRDDVISVRVEQVGD